MSAGGKGSLVDFIISMNLHRRHLNESQKGACARDALPFLREEAKARQRLSEGRGKKGSEKIHNLNGTNGRATEHAANLFGTNWRYVYDADKIAEEHPKYFDKIKSGELTIPNAKKKIKSELVLKLEPLIAEKAKKQQGTRTDIQQNSAECFGPIDTRKELARLAGVSHDTIDKARLIGRKGKLSVARAKDEGF